MKKPEASWWSRNVGSADPGDGGGFDQFVPMLGTYLRGNAPQKMIREASLSLFDPIHAVVQRGRSETDLSTKSYSHAACPRLTPDPSLDQVEGEARFVSRTRSMLGFGGALLKSFGPNADDLVWLATRYGLTALGLHGGPFVQRDCSRYFFSPP